MPNSKIDPSTILTTPTPPEPIPPYLSPQSAPKIRSIENTASLLEHRLVETLLDILDTGSDRDRLSAVSQTAEVLGKKSKQQVVITDSLNIQNNNAFLDHFKSNAPKELIQDANTPDMPAP